MRNKRGKLKLMLTEAHEGREERPSKDVACMSLSTVSDHAKPSFIGTFSCLLLVPGLSWFCFGFVYFSSRSNLGLENIPMEIPP
jgi:hypothetical protein